MNDLLAFPIDLALPLLVGCSVVLIVGWLGIQLSRTPISRQRLGELTMGLCLVWMLTPLLPEFERVSWLNEIAPDDRPRAWIDPTSKTNQAIATQEVDADDIDREVVDAGPMEIAADNSSQAAPEQDIDATGVVHRKPVQEPIANSLKSKESTSVVSEIDGDLIVHDGERVGPEQGSESDRAVVPSTLAAWSLDWKRSLLIAYLGGAAMVSVWLVVGHVLLAWRVRQAEPIDSKYVNFMSTFRGSIPRILVSKDFRRVVSFGLLRPTIMVPLSLIQTGQPEQIKQVLLHELGHVRQRDALGQCLMNIVLIFLYFHPIYWMVRRQVCFDRELVVDDWAALRSCKEKYATAMVWLAKQQLGPSFGPVMVMSAVDVRKSLFFRRIKMLVQRSSSLATRRSWGSSIAQTMIMAALVATMAFSLSVPSAFAQDADESKIKDLQKQILMLKKERDHMMELIKRMEQDMISAQRDAIRAANKEAHARLAAEARDDLLATEATKAEPNWRAVKAADALLTAAEEVTTSETPEEEVDSILGNPSSKVEKSARDAMVNSRGPALPVDVVQTGASAIELTQFADQYSDALVDMEINAADLEELEKSYSKGIVSKREMRVAAIKAEAAKRKVSLYQRVAKSLIRKTEMNLQQRQLDLARTKKLVEAGFVPESDLITKQILVQDLQSTLEILNEIL